MYTPGTEEPSALVTTVPSVQVKGSAVVARLRPIHDFVDTAACAWAFSAAELILGSSTEPVYSAGHYITQFA